MIADAEKGLFDMVVVKDISRFARNTVDLLQNVRKLKALGIETQFLTANMTSMGNSEFVLNIFGALAQEESANTSKRVKFGKKMNTEKGRVPNIVYGYDKTIGDYFNLGINKEEAKVVQQIYKWYTEGGYGASKENRSKGGLQHDYDIVIGPAADDNTMETVQLYIADILTASETVERLRYNRVNNQISFHTEKALEHLTLIRRTSYDKKHI